MQESGPSREWKYVNSSEIFNLMYFVQGIFDREQADLIPEYQLIDQSSEPAELQFAQWYVNFFMMINLAGHFSSSLLFVSRQKP